jgi:peptidoglycan/LPS O-acetylase OafA/YrhL
MPVAAEDKKGFWSSNKGRAAYLVAVVAGFLSYISILHFLVSNSIISNTAYSLGLTIYCVLLILAPAKNEKDSRVAHKIRPYLIVASAVCFALILFVFFLVSNSLITRLDYNDATLYIFLAFAGTSIIMFIFAERREWQATKRAIEPKPQFTQHFNPRFSL